jgi:CheY-like chemotaxis protein
VEDELAIRTLLAECLVESDFSVDLAEDGLAALECVRQTRPDLVILDLMMPRLDGLGFLREAQTIPGFPQVPVVIVSAAYSLAEAGRAFPHQVRATLGKPFDLDVLLTIATFLTGQTTTPFDFDETAAPDRASS